MKKTKLSLILAGLVITTGVLISSCKKSTTSTVATDTSTTSSVDNNTAQQSAHDITNIGSQGIENDNGSLSTYRNSNGGGLPKPMSGSVNVNVNTTNKNMTVTFINYVGYDGHTRNGTLYYDWSGSTNNAVWYRDSGLVLNVSTPGNTYSVDGYTVEIVTKTITNNGRNSSGQLNWTDNSNIKILKPNGGGTILWNASWNIALLNTSSYIYTTYNGTANTYTYSGVFHGYGGTVANSIDWAQAIISVSTTSGTSFSGTASDGETYTGNISSPLILNLNCATPLYSKYLYVAGTLNFTPSGKATRTINYGNGICDLTYTVSIGAFSVTITV